MSRLTIPVGASDHTQGPADAPVTMVEYGDYQCPYCGEAYPILQQVQRAMGDRLRFVFRNFPITQAHPYALGAAQFAEAAAAEDKFWQAHDALYERQDALRPSDLMEYGEELGLRSTGLRNAFNGSFDEKIQADFMGGVRSGVNGTPTLFINGQRYDGPRDADSLVEVLGRVADEAQR